MKLFSKNTQSSTELESLRQFREKHKDSLMSPEEAEAHLKKINFANVQVIFVKKSKQLEPSKYTSLLTDIIKAAEQGDAGAQCSLGVMYEFGKGVPSDYAEAKRWFLKSAEQGYSSAQYILGEKYRKGNGVPKDYAEAAKWYRMAASQGDIDAQSALDEMIFHN
jgi:TPR repeat protein